MEMDEAGRHDVAPGAYRHFKGGRYEVIGVATDTETELPVVVYRSSNGRLWVRSLAMFTEIVERDGYVGPRFVRDGTNR